MMAATGCDGCNGARMAFRHLRLPHLFWSVYDSTKGPSIQDVCNIFGSFHRQHNGYIEDQLALWQTALFRASSFLSAKFLLVVPVLKALLCERHIWMAQGVNSIYKNLRAPFVHATATTRLPDAPHLHRVMVLSEHNGRYITTTRVEGAYATSPNLNISPLSSGDGVMTLTGQNSGCKMV